VLPVFILQFLVIVVEWNLKRISEVKLFSRHYERQLNLLFQIYAAKCFPWEWHVKAKVKECS
jgi:hypothetical protein